MYLHETLDLTGVNAIPADGVIYDIPHTIGLDLQGGGERLVPDKIINEWVSGDTRLEIATISDSIIGVRNNGILPIQALLFLSYWHSIQR